MNNSRNKSNNFCKDSELKTNTASTQSKIDESAAGIPSDEWLNSPKVFASKKKHLELLGLLSAKSEKSLVLDAGCGPGTYGLILAEQGYDVIGIDISELAVKKANERALKKNLHFQAEKGDLEHLGFNDNTFDLIFVGWALHHFPSLEQVCSELYRVLKPGGKIAIVEPNEANLMAKFSRLVENILSPIVLKVGWDTPNMTVHYYDEYLQALQKTDIINLAYSSCYANLPSILNSHSIAKSMLLKPMYYLRSMLFKIGTKTLRRPLNGPDLLITGIKNNG